MKLPFMQQFPWGEKTYFIEKLWTMVYRQGYYTKIALLNYRILSPENFHKILPTEHLLNVTSPKLHTIRNYSERFKVGQFVQPFIWTYMPYRRNPDSHIPAQFDFIPPLKIVSKQKFEIKIAMHKALVLIDDRALKEDEIEQLAINDGFKDVNLFFKYFNKPVENMEIRHFTDLKY